VKRVVEPELMTGAAQARAYARADFETAHSAYPNLFAARFPRAPRRARVLDLGCGPCDVTIRFARANPGWTFHAVDGSAAMLRYARTALARHRGLSRRIKLIHGFLPGARLPRRRFDVVLASSFLHHLHDPRVLWRTIREFSGRGTIVFIADLRRPGSRARARALVRQYSGGEPGVLRRDFYNSLLAAFTPAEVRRQLRAAGLPELCVETVSNRHLLVFGTVAGPRPVRVLASSAMLRTKSGTRDGAGTNAAALRARDKPGRSARPPARW
jgi:SAM-dependent methyltransferase